VKGRCPLKIIRRRFALRFRRYGKKVGRRRRAKFSCNLIMNRTRIHSKASKPRLSEGMNDLPLTKITEQGPFMQPDKGVIRIEEETIRFRKFLTSQLQTTSPSRDI
jgi:hypothetical protein